LGGVFKVIPKKSIYVANFISCSLSNFTTLTNAFSLKVTYKKYMTNKEYFTTLKEELITKRKFKVIPLHR